MPSFAEHLTQLRLVRNALEDEYIPLRQLGAIALDPYLLWACETDFRYFNPFRSGREAHARLLVELRPEAALDGSGLAALNQLQSVTVASMYTQPALHLIGLRFFSAEIHLRPFIESLRDCPELQNLVQSLTLSQPISPRSHIAPEQQYANSSTSALWPNGFDLDYYATLCEQSSDGDRQLLITGVADNGFGFLNQRFCTNTDGTSRTRFIALWDQNPSQHVSNYRELNFTAGYGQTYSSSAIDALLQTGGSEQQRYRNEQLRRLNKTFSHGTAVLDLAAGAEASSNDSAPILAVQLLQPESGDDNSGIWLAAALLDALHFMLHSVDTWWLAQRQTEYDLALPQLIVNISYSVNAGPHNGQSAFEKALDELIEHRTVKGRCTLVVVFSAGNNQQASTHATVKLKPGAQYTLHWQLPPADLTPSFVEIYSQQARDHYRIKLRTPSGQSIEQQAQQHGPPQPYPVQLHDRTTDNRATMVLPAGSAVARASLIAIAPTRAEEFGPQCAAAGTWSIQLSNTSEHSITLDAWVQNDLTWRAERQRGRQSYFVETEHSPLDSPVINRHNTINALTTGQHSIVVGAYLADTGQAANYSAIGTALGKQPDVYAVGGESTDLGVSATGLCSATQVYLSGTSAAAPCLSRRLTEQLLKQPDERPQKAIKRLMKADKKKIKQRYGKLKRRDLGMKIKRILPKKD